jgi:hypothetical protein
VVIWKVPLCINNNILGDMLPLSSGLQSVNWECYYVKSVGCKEQRVWSLGSMRGQKQERMRTVKVGKGDRTQSRVRRKTEMQSSQDDCGQAAEGWRWEKQAMGAAVLFWEHIIGFYNLLTGNLYIVTTPYNTQHVTIHSRGYSSNTYLFWHKGRATNKQ